MVASGAGGAGVAAAGGLVDGPACAALMASAKEEATELVVAIEEVAGVVGPLWITVVGGIPGLPTFTLNMWVPGTPVFTVAPTAGAL